MGFEIINLINKTKNLVLNTALDQKIHHISVKKLKILKTNRLKLILTSTINQKMMYLLILHVLRPHLSMCLYVSNIMFQWLLAQQDLMIFI